MSRVRAVILVLLLVAVAVAAWMLLARPKHQRLLSGYIEADTLYLASPVAGTVASVHAVEGSRVAAGEPLFTIDPATLSAQGQQAAAGTAAARTQIASASANVEQAQADVAATTAAAERARRDLARLLSVKGDDAAAVANKDIDQARAALREAEARVAAARQAADARRAQVSAARAQVEQARGNEREVAIRVGQLSPAAPAPARVEDIFFQAGEWVSPNQPVVSLIPDGKVKVRFFVPEAEVSRYRPGGKVRFSCDGCAGGLAATIRYVSPRPEFTPPVIFSRDTRDRLVFMVEAYPADSAKLQPGLPVDVVPLP